MDGKSLFLSVSTMRKNRMYVISKSMVGCETFGIYLKLELMRIDNFKQLTMIICESENNSKTAFTYFVCSFSHNVKKF